MNGTKRILAAALAASSVAAVMASAAVAQAGWVWSYGSWAGICYDNVSYLTAKGDANLGPCGITSKVGSTHIVDQAGIANNEYAGYSTRLKISGVWQPGTSYHEGNETETVSLTSCELNVSDTQCRVKSGICTGTGCPL